MKQASFFEGLAVALIASISGSAAFATLTSVFSAMGVFRLVIAGLSLAYVLYLLARSQERVGRVTVISVWLVVTTMSSALIASPIFYIAIQLCLIWLVRSLYFYSSIVSALADLGMCALSLAIAIWAWTHSQSLFLSLWCFFLVQALFVMIPRQLTTSRQTQAQEDSTKDSFEYAHRAAETAVRKLTSTY